MSELNEKMNIYQKLNVIQVNLDAPKTQYNKFGEYKYRNCEDILVAVKPYLSDLKVNLILSDDVVKIGDENYVKATATLIDSESFGGEHVVSTALAREQQQRAKFDCSQLTGSASSYARKYALNGLFAIDDTKDADNQDNTSIDNQANNQNLICKQCNGYVKDVIKPDNTTAKAIDVVKGTDGLCYECFNKNKQIESNITD